MAAKKKVKRVGSATTRTTSTTASKKAAAARGTGATKSAKAPAKSAKLPAKSAKPSAKSAKLPAKSAKLPAKIIEPESVERARPMPRKRSAEGAEMSLPQAVAAVSPGDAAPSFSLPDETGDRVSSRDLAGRPYVLYFYPKDDTPGCTTEACGFRDALPDFEKLGVRVIGVSPDSSASHERFRAKYELPFTLLSDADKQLSTAYGAWALKKNYGREYMGVVRSTFLVDSDGVVQGAWRGVKVNGHVEKVQTAAAALG